MTEYSRRWKRNLTLDDVEIRVTDTTRMNTNEGFARFRLRYRDAFRVQRPIRLVEHSGRHQ